MAERVTLLLATAAALGEVRPNARASAAAAAALPRVSTGRLVRVERFESRHVDARASGRCGCRQATTTRGRMRCWWCTTVRCSSTRQHLEQQAWALDRVLAGLIASRPGARHAGGGALEQRPLAARQSSIRRGSCRTCSRRRCARRFVEQALLRARRTAADCCASSTTSFGPGDRAPLRHAPGASTGA